MAGCDVASQKRPRLTADADRADRARTTLTTFIVNWRWSSLSPGLLTLFLPLGERVEFFL